MVLMLASCWSNSWVELGSARIASSLSPIPANIQWPEEIVSTFHLWPQTNYFSPLLLFWCLFEINVTHLSDLQQCILCSLPILFGRPLNNSMTENLWWRACLTSLCPRSSKYAPRASACPLRAAAPTCSSATREASSSPISLVASARWRSPWKPSTWPSP